MKSFLRYAAPFDAPPCRMSLFIDAEAKDAPSKKAFVVGAGVAGLYAAYLLTKEGYEVRVYEASDRVGGLVESRELCDGSVVELGPSHHLETHARLARLLDYGGGVREEFNPPEVVDVVDAETVDAQKVEKVEGDLFRACTTPSQTFAECASAKKLSYEAERLPWWGELKHFQRRHARPTSEDGQAWVVKSVGAPNAPTAPAKKGGYQQALSAVADRLRTEKNVMFTLDRQMNSLRRLYADAGPEWAKAEVFLALPPAALLATDWREPAEQYLRVACRGWKSIRVFACFAEERMKLLKCFHDTLKNKHIVSRSSLFGWAVVVSPRVWLLSYTDAERAERVLEAINAEGPGSIWTSFLEHIGEHFGLATAELPVPYIVYREDYEGDAYHTRRGGGALATGGGGDHYLKVGPGVWAVGEAYGPPELHAWMEGACASAEAAVLDALGATGERGGGARDIEQACIQGSA